MRPMSRDLAHLSEEALVALIARGEETALAELYDRFCAPAFALARRVLRDDNLAEDAVQEGFLDLWRGAGRYLPERGRASSWLLMLVHRRAVDLVRRSERRRTDVLDDVPDAVGDSVEEIGWLRLERERVQAALKVLPDAERESIELAYYGGFSQSEIAERIGQPLGTIKSRTFSGLRRLRDVLGEDALEREWDPSSYTT
jgi:RNA polymerase sigma factor (sigma-70 family)